MTKCDTQEIKPLSAPIMQGLVRVKILCGFATAVNYIR